MTQVGEHVAWLDSSDVLWAYSVSRHDHTEKYFLQRKDKHLGRRGANVALLCLIKLVDSELRVRETVRELPHRALFQSEVRIMYLLQDQLTVVSVTHQAE